MIIILIIVAIVIASVAMIVFGHKMVKDALFITGFWTCIVFGASLLAFFIVIISENTNYDLHYQKLQSERDAIVYQMERGMYLGDSLGDFNRKLIDAKWCHESPWTCWFTGDYVMDVDLIPTE